MKTPKSIFATVGLSLILIVSNLIYAGSFSDSTNGGGGGASGHKSGSIVVPAGAGCLYFGGTISDGHNPPGTAAIYGPLGYDYINYAGHSNPSATSMTPIAAGTYSYSLDAYGMAYCGLAVQW